MNIIYRLGVDLGGTNIAVGIVDENGKIIEKASVKTMAPRKAEEIVADMTECIKGLLLKLNLKFSDVLSAGIGVPGAIDTENGVVTFSNNLQFFDVALVEMLKKYTGLDFYIANDANAAAVGEFIAGSGKGTDNFVTITLGTGIGGGIIIDKKLYTGKNGAAAELGHMTVFADGIECSCGRKGCFERYASATALILQTKEEMKKNPDSIMWKLCHGDINRANGITAFIAMHEGDKSGKAVVDNYVRYLAAGVINIINIFQPDVLSIGGGVSGSGDDITVPLIEYVEKEDYARHSKIRTKIKIASLGNDAGIIGAAFLDKA